MSEDGRRRTALVLGAGSDIGRALIARYLEEDFNILAYVRPETSHSIVPSEHLSIVELDLRDLHAVEQHVRYQKDLDQVDVMVCLAAQVAPSSVADVTAVQLTESMNVGALANFLFMGRLGPAMASRGWGRIVIGSSIGVRFGGGDDSFAYALSRHSAEFLPRITREWAARDVLTNVIRIGITETAAHGNFPGRNLDERIRLVPVRRAARPSEIADYFYWHGSKENTFVTGQVMAISGGE